eukprot:TRINITY_DN59737_c0_g1_i1.p1 TRINITY_DN59737_c0_g1~~TRINITY_DN59737_c0_g1_i1.p1  ORF type:complete len:106 (+),score=10.76 TRINITY_DN59737_c0_g1_i1:3-320(+)
MGMWYKQGQLWAVGEGHASKRIIPGMVGECKQVKRDQASMALAHSSLKERFGQVVVCFGLPVANSKKNCLSPKLHQWYNCQYIVFRQVNTYQAVYKHELVWTSIM